MKSVFFTLLKSGTILLIFSAMYLAYFSTTTNMELSGTADASDYAMDQNQETETRIQKNLKMSRSKEISSNKSHQKSQSFSWPLRSVNRVDPGYFYICNYFDHDGRADYFEDYNCGQRTYDGHQGSDFCPGPFRWYKMDYNQVYVVAAAPGTIIDKMDGAYDRRCDKDSDWDKNEIIILHDDGSQTRYNHLKNNSLTPKAVGDRVEVGEYLGVVGSSGRSSGPHLHFQVTGSQGNDIDPFAGSCNNASSLWDNQRPYNDSAINALMTHTAEPEFPDCPNQEIPHQSNSFKLGDTIYFAAYYRDRLAGQKTIYTIKKPNGSIFSTWEKTYGESYSFISWDFRSYEIPLSESDGKWTYEAEYQGSTYQHNFFVGDYSNTPPQAIITSPGNNVSLSFNQGVVFIGSGFDFEDGNLHGNSLVWTSSMDGVIGEGNIVIVSNLSENNHLITLTSTDEKGVSGEQSISISVTNDGGGDDGNDGGDSGSGGGGGGGCSISGASD